MQSNDIGKAVRTAEDYLRSQTSPGPRADVPATASIEDGLRCRIETPDGQRYLHRHAEECRRQRNGQLAGLALARRAGKL